MLVIISQLSNHSFFFFFFEMPDGTVLWFYSQKHNVRTSCVFIFFAAQPGVEPATVAGGRLGWSAHNGLVVLRGDALGRRRTVRSGAHQQRGQLLDAVDQEPLKATGRQVLFSCCSHQPMPGARLRPLHLPCTPRAAPLGFRQFRLTWTHCSDWCRFELVGSLFFFMPLGFTRGLRAAVVLSGRWQSPPQAALRESLPF